MARLTASQTKDICLPWKTLNVGHFHKIGTLSPWDIHKEDWELSFTDDIFIAKRFLQEIVT